MSALSACILGCGGLNLTEEESRFFGDAQPWGFILFARNCEHPDQVRSLVGSLRESVGRDAPVLIDQEGGRVQRMWPPHWRRWMPPLDQIARAGVEGPRSMYLRSRLVAEELRSVGIDVNCIPLVDIAGPKTHPFLKNRCYGTEVDVVIGAARSVSEGLMDGAVLPVLKHLPGHGRATTDSHNELPVVTASADDLRANDFVPFGALNHLPLGMTAHIVFSAFDAERPVTCSETMIGVIRDWIGFSGLLMTDDISMEALDGKLGERCGAARASGCDLVLHCNGDSGEMRVVVEACGELEGHGLRRAEAALAMRSQPQAIDIQAVEAELEAIVNRKVDG